VTHTHIAQARVRWPNGKQWAGLVAVEPAHSVGTVTVSCLGKQRVNSSFLALFPWALAALGCGLPSLAMGQTEIAKSRAPAADGAGRTEVVKTAPAAPVSAAQVDQVATITAALLRVDGGQTILELHTSRAVAPQVFVLSQPDRVIVDSGEMEFHLPPGAGQSGAGLVAGFRYGLVTAGRSRMVIDATRPVRVKRAVMMAATAGRPARFEVELETAPADVPLATLPQTVLPPSPAAAATPGAFAERKPNAKFVVMIDPGHGGVDGGAISSTRMIEKDLTLAVARQLKAALDARPGYDVRLTRTADTFVSLDARVELSQAAAADLFISIHADSVGDPAVARTAHGATVYTLSETASNQAAQQLAEKENAADQAGGLVGGSDAEATQVSSILADLVKREAHNFSLQFKSLLIDRLRPSNMLARDPSRAAAFKVLRQIQTPTVLIELGFLTHEMDAQQMQTVDWQKRIAGAIASAVDSYAGKRAAAAR
jgi:N-acetylmuramoyl-L-alanine amidase